MINLNRNNRIKESLIKNKPEFNLMKSIAAKTL